MSPLSVAIACRNNADKIGRTLESVRGLAGEIIAADSGSTDGTIELLEADNATIIRTPWLGYVRTKQLAVDHCTLPWVLLLDSDESPEPEMVDAIRDLVEADDPAVAGARVNRKICYRGKLLQHAFQPEWRLRLARRDRMTIAGYDPHDRVDVDTSGGARVIDLPGDLRHDSFDTFKEHFSKQVGHARLAAESLHKAGKRGSVGKTLTAAPSELLKQVVFKSAWRDGTPGWLSAFTMASYGLLKHAILLELEHLARTEPGTRDGADDQRPGPS